MLNLRMQLLEIQIDWGKPQMQAAKMNTRVVAFGQAKGNVKIILVTCLSAAAPVVMHAIALQLFLGECESAKVLVRCDVCSSSRQHP